MNELALDDPKIANLTFEESVPVAAFEDGGRIFLLLDTGRYAKGDLNVGRNVLSVNKNGQVLWRIPASGLRQKSRYRATSVPESFFGL